MSPENFLFTFSLLLFQYVCLFRFLFPACSLECICYEGNDCFLFFYFLFSLLCLQCFIHNRCSLISGGCMNSSYYSPPCPYREERWGWMRALLRMEVLSSKVLNRNFDFTMDPTFQSRFHTVWSGRKRSSSFGTRIATHFQIPFLMFCWGNILNGRYGK